MDVDMIQSLNGHDFLELNLIATEKNIQLYAPVIVKYRDGSTDAATALEEALR